MEAATTMTTGYARDLTEDERWPLYRTEALRATPVRGVLSPPMFAHSRHMGALNAHAEEAGAFPADAVTVGSVYVSLGALVWGVITSQGQFEAGLQSRDVIGQAKGMLMERFSITSDAAFNTLKKVSQDTNTPLRKVAADLVGMHNKEFGGT